MSLCLCGAIDCPSCGGVGGYDPGPACARCDDTGLITVLAGGDPDREEERWCPDCGDAGASEDDPRERGDDDGVDYADPRRPDEGSW